MRELSIVEVQHVSGGTGKAIFGTLMGLSIPLIPIGAVALGIGAGATILSIGLLSPISVPVALIGAGVMTFGIVSTVVTAVGLGISPI